MKSLPKGISLNDFIEANKKLLPNLTQQRARDAYIYGDLDQSQTAIYIGAFLLSLIFFNWFFGKKAMFYLLLLVFIGALMVLSQRYKISITGITGG
jgi:hypothetical protein